MFTSNFVSITDLRQGATRIIKSLKKAGDTIVFVNNRPRAVLMSYEDYQSLIERPVEFYSYPYEDLTKEDKKLLQETKQMSDTEFVDF